MVHRPMPSEDGAPVEDAVAVQTAVLTNDVRVRLTLLDTGQLVVEVWTSIGPESWQYQAVGITTPGTYLKTMGGSLVEVDPAQVEGEGSGEAGPPPPVGFR